MKNAKILTGIVAAPITAALSFALLACGDDSSSSTAPEPITEGNSSAVENPSSSSSELSPDTTCCKVTSSSSSEEQGSSSSEEPSSSSVLSSSSFDIHMSSMTCCQDLVQSTDDVFGTCLDKNVDPMVDAALPPVAYMIPEEGIDSVAIVIENVSMACEAISGTAGMIRRPPIKQVSVGTNYSNLNVVPKMDESRVQTDCLCSSRLIFKIEAKSNFVSATTLNVVFDDNAINEIPIVKDDSTVVGDTIPAAQDSVPESNQTELELNGYARGKCMDNDLAAKPVAKSAASELPEATQITYMNGQTILTLENVMDYCGIEAKVSQKMVGDTLMLDYYDQGAVTKCICNFDKIEFLLEPENTAARYVKFKDEVYWVNVIMYEVDPNWEG